jgi:hypothetical protein
LQYAMPSIADSSLKEYYETSCTECDHMLFDIPMNFNLHYNVLEHTSERITIETASPDNELTSGHLAEITLVKHNGKWKMDEYLAWSLDDRPLDISQEQAERYIFDNYSDWLDIESLEFNYYDQDEDLYYFDLYTKDGEYYEVKVDRSTGYLYSY